MTVYLHQLIQEATVRLSPITEAPEREARLLMAFMLQRTYEDIYFSEDYILKANEATAFQELLSRRLNHEPLSKIKEEREFWGLPFRISAHTLDPRPDSETLIGAVCQYFPIKNQALSILDLGTGTGCLLLSLLHEYPNAWGVGVDKSEAAALIAQENATTLGLSSRARFLVGNWGNALSSTFDIIVSNPPYIGEKEVLPKEVSLYDPPLALFAGHDGLSCYRELANQLPKLSTPDSKIFLELGVGQLQPIVNIFSNYTLIKVKNDLTNRQRCVVFTSNFNKISKMTTDLLLK